VEAMGDKLGFGVEVPSEGKVQADMGVLASVEEDAYIENVVLAAYEEACPSDTRAVA
jgi:hypothetical protein